MMRAPSSLTCHIGFVASLAHLYMYGAIADAPLVFDPVGYNNGTYGADPHQLYHSADIVSPLLQVNKWDSDKTDNASFIFLTITDPTHIGHSGPVIYRAEDLSLVYSEPRWNAVHNAHVGHFNDRDYLVFLEQTSVDGKPSTNCLLYDSSYELAYNVSSHSPNGSFFGIHECFLTSHGSATIVLTETTPFDLSPVGGDRDGNILDNIIQEIDVQTGQLLWEWRASKFFDITETYQELAHGFKGAFDYIHMNSVEKTGEGNFLLSSRHLHSITFVDGSTGNIIWVLGGKKNQFKDLSDGHATDFHWQHHARFTNAELTRLSMFDNHNITTTIGCKVNCSRARHVELDYEYMTARLVQEFYHPQSLVSGFEGSYYSLPGGNVLVGWGANPTFTEHMPDGECVLDVQFDMWRTEHGYPVNYRAFKMGWKAFPKVWFRSSRPSRPWTSRLGHNHHGAT
ncbi:Arylsulfotransferase-domain-containing protein [Xylariaceae sp. FL1019]|nr:Arylsulfotransferase-domain-containing protein [Xylariaceae sp. FL1019]